MRWKLSILPTLLVLISLPVSAESVDPDLPRLIREAQKPRVQYGPARVGWNESAKPVATANLTFESLRWDSPAAIRNELKAVLMPPWQILATLAALIFGLRRLRSTRDGVRPGAAEVVSFPLPRPREEAA